MSKAVRDVCQTALATTARTMSITKPYKTYRFLNRRSNSGGRIEGSCHAGGLPDGAASDGGAAVLTNAAPQLNRSDKHRHHGSRNGSRKRLIVYPNVLKTVRISQLKDNA
jgi:hypothetical protein